MNLNTFDRKKAESYAAEAERKWGNTDAYREYEKKAAGRSEEKKDALAADMMRIFAEFGAMTDKPVTDGAVRKQVEKLRGFITENYYTCTETILAELGQMYAVGGEMTDNIDACGGKGTAAFAAGAIAAYCK